MVWRMPPRERGRPARTMSGKALALFATRIDPELLSFGLAVEDAADRPATSSTGRQLSASQRNEA